MRNKVKQYSNVAQAFFNLKTNKEGLTQQQASMRLKTYGYNVIEEKKKNSFIQFIRRFYGPIPIMLFIAFIITFIIGHYVDSYIILSLILFNAFVGYIEESKADNAIELLKSKLNVRARVLRSSNWSLIDAKEIVPGDIIRVRMGDILPADAMVITAEWLECDQSTLTGESYPVKKGIDDILFSTSKVSRGEGLCVIIATGYQTSYGKTAKLVSLASPKEHLQALIISITKHLIFIDVILSIIIGIVAISLFNYTLIQILPFILVLLIASVPVSLPAAFTTTMALGTKKLSKNSILVTKLEAIESAATLNVLCFDKTGTITENKLTVKEVFTINHNSVEDVILYAALCSRLEDNDPLDTAILEYLGQRKISTNGFNTIKFTPFEPATKMSSALLLSKKTKITVSKGALSAISTAYKISKHDHALAVSKIEEYSKANLRTIVVAKKIGLIHQLLGIIAMYDPPRKESKMLIQEIVSLGVKVKMLTGDNAQVAGQIASEIGIKGPVVDARELKNKNKTQMQSIIEKSSIFAEIYPEDKYTIVKVLQDLGYRVGMTGDGINDAPALKQADVGIAVENATDIAKSVSALVLERNGISVIVDAIKESRKIFEKMKTYAIVKITRVIQILTYITIAFLVLGYMPILASELILLIFTNDIINISVSTDNTIYSQKPDKWNTKVTFKISIILGILMLIISLIFIPIGLSLTSNQSQFQTFSFIMISITDTILLYLVRSRERTLGVNPSFILVSASVFSLIFVVIISFYGILIPSISVQAILSVLVLSVVMMSILMFFKRYLFRYAGYAF